MTIEEHDDELASAYLDGEATAEEAERVTADPALMARVADFRALRDQVGQPVPMPDDTTKDALIARAIAESTTSPKVSSLDAAREQRRPNRTIVAIGSVAAAILALLIAVPLVFDLGGDDDADLTASTEVALEEPTDAAGNGDAELGDGAVARSQTSDRDTEGLDQGAATAAESLDEADAEALAEPAEAEAALEEEEALEEAAAAPEAAFDEPAEAPAADAADEATDALEADTAAGGSDADLSQLLPYFSSTTSQHDDLAGLQEAIRAELDLGEAGSLDELAPDRAAAINDLVGSCAQGFDPSIGEIVLARLDRVGSTEVLVFVIEDQASQRLLVLRTDCEQIADIPL